MTKPRHRDTPEICQAAARNGWYPAPQSHLPAEIRRALHRFGIRPAIKECFRNCQRFVLEANYADRALAARVSYVEGFAFSGRAWFVHAWLLLDGEVLDLTLGPGREYAPRHTATTVEIAQFILENRYGSMRVSERDLLCDPQPFASAVVGQTPPRRRKTLGTRG